ncbi:MAG: hypothetical protein GXX85_02265 [Ignavibacteria bacterium]|nr:hypothetical protein [Ignavibacteria bacterium]
MESINKQERVDELIQQFWKLGYLTVSRKYGTYLPEPPKMGHYDIDALGKIKNQYAIGISLTSEEIHTENIGEKLLYLATRHTKNTNRSVQLFITVPKKDLFKVKDLVSKFEDEIKRNIKVVAVDTEGIN